MPQFSAIVATYNHGHFLPRAITALAAQQPAADEIILIDDGSTDDTVAILDRLAKLVPSLRVMRNRQNLGAIASLNRGIEAAQGEFIYLGAADDVVLPGLFADGLSLLN